MLQFVQMARLRAAGTFSVNSLPAGALWPNPAALPIPLNSSRSTLCEKVSDHECNLLEMRFKCEVACFQELHDWIRVVAPRGLSAGWDPLPDKTF